MIHIGYRKVVVILLGNFHHLKALNPAAESWISFKAGKTTRMISLNTTASNLGTNDLPDHYCLKSWHEICRAMAFFHAFTGSGSSFKFKDMPYCRKLMHEFHPHG